MSLALATKGVIAGIGWGTGNGEGGIYPADYIASTLMIDVDLAHSIEVAVEHIDLEIDLNLNGDIQVSVDLDTLQVSVSESDESIEVRV